MKAGFWTCPRCETENPETAATCGTCPTRRERDELAGVTHFRHLMTSVTNRGKWRIADTGPGYVIVAARSQALAAAKAAQLLRQDARADQSVVVTQVRHRGWLLYVRSDLTPYPSTVNSWSAAGEKKPAPAAPRSAREPVEGQPYIGRVLVWFPDKGYGSIFCSDRSIGNVPVRRTDLDERQESYMRAGQHVGFTIKRTPDGMLATGIVPLGPLIATE